MDTKIRKFIRLLRRSASRMPEDIQLEIANRCNFSCPMCPRTVMKVPQKDMPWPLFKEIIQKIGTPAVVVLTGWGEPLIHPDFLRMVAFLNQKLPSTRIKFTTNGALLTPKLISLLSNLSIAEITLSIDALQGPTPGHKGDRALLEKIRKLIRTRGCRPHPRVNLQSVISDTGLEPLSRIIALGHQYHVDKINLLRLTRIFDPHLPRPSFTQEQETIHLAKKIGQKTKTPVFSLNTFQPLRYLATHGDRICLRQDNHIYITVEGQVTPCCNLRHLSYGDLTKNSLATIWHNPLFRRFRAQGTKLCQSCDALTWKQKS